MQRATFEREPQCWRVAAVFRCVEESPYLAGLIARAGGYYMATWSFYAAVQLMATQDGNEALGRYFADGAEAEAWGSDVFVAELEDFCRRHEEQIVGLVRDRRCQMNEVNRCAAALVPALAYVHSHVDRRPIALIEVGASAGLQLLFDRFRYEYLRLEAAAAASARAGPEALADSAGPTGPATRSVATAPATIAVWSPPRARDDVTLRCRVVGDSMPDPAAVSGLVASRVGIDLDPPRLDDPVTRDWIVASAAMRSGLTARLIDVVRTSGVQVLAADAVDVIEQIIADVPVGQLPVVYDSASLMYLDADRVADFRACLHRAARQREVAWISYEAMRATADGSVTSVQGAPMPPAVKDEVRAGAFLFAVELTVFGSDQAGVPSGPNASYASTSPPPAALRQSEGVRDSDAPRLLATAHPWGLWVDWLADSG